ncbi:MAG: hypothetical protein LUE06_04665 [Oscillospiraceae bacterium]|nr:hypothetical protein [Oscillospiraceae bacterium]
MKKRIFASIILAVVLISGFCFTANAQTREAFATPSLTFDGNTATCTARIVKAGKISATLELWQGSTLVDSWDDSGTSYLLISGSHAVTSGKAYTVKVSGTVDGVAFSSSASPKVCP